MKWRWRGRGAARDRVFDNQRPASARPSSGERWHDRPCPANAFHIRWPELVGFEGDTLASALMANGVRLVGRSFKYHRPRGILTAGAEEPNALVELRSGDRREPNTRATMAELFEGMEARSQNRWPSLRHDFLAINGLLSPVLKAGFYYKTFMWPAAFWEKVYEPLIRRAAGLGPGRRRRRSRHLREGLSALRRAGDRRRARRPDGGAGGWPHRRARGIVRGRFPSRRPASSQIAVASAINSRRPGSRGSKANWTSLPEVRILRRTTVARCLRRRRVYGARALERSRRATARA